MILMQGWSSADPEFHRYEWFWDESVETKGRNDTYRYRVLDQATNATILPEAECNDTEDDECGDTEDDKCDDTEDDKCDDTEDDQCDETEDDESDDSEDDEDKIKILYVGLAFKEHRKHISEKYISEVAFQSNFKDSDSDSDSIFHSDTALAAHVP